MAATRHQARWWQLWLAIGTVAIGGYFLVPNDMWQGNAYYDVIGLASAAVLVIGVRMHRPTKAIIWYLFAAGQALWSIGDMAFGVNEFLLDGVYPSFADGIYLAAYPVLAM